MKPVTVIFDFSNLAYTSFFRALTALQIKPEDARDPFDAHVGTFVNKIQDCLDGVYWSETIYAMEGRSRKHSIYPDYKAKRKTKQLQVDPKGPLYELLKSWRAQIIWNPEEEADDSISSYVAQNFEQDFLIYSTDKDLWQLLDHDNVSIYDPTRKEKITQEHVEKSFNLTQPNKIKLHKTFWGDPSDNIPNAVPRMQKQLLPVIEECDGTLEDALVRAEAANLTKRCADLVRGADSMLRINYQLASLSFRAKIQKMDIADWMVIEEKRKADLEAWRSAQQVSC